MSSYKVRPATLHDAQAVTDIHAQADAAACKGLAPEAQLDPIPAEKRLAFWREAIEYGEPQVHVALDGDQVVGFVGFDRSRDKGTKPTVGEIWAIYVIPSHWGRGIGLALWDAARDGLQDEGCTQVTVWLRLGNERALRFHEHAAGFKREMASLKTVPLGSVRVEEIRLRRALV